MISLTKPNTTMNGKGFYVSFNQMDWAIYGDVTTALVDNQMVNFFILNGDHRKNYKELIPLGWDACMKYYRDNINLINKYSSQEK